MTFRRSQVRSLYRPPLQAKAPAKTFYVAMALKQMGKRTELVVFSDDMDGLRKIPKNINVAWLEEHLGKPVSRTPDPYGCCESYSAHMNRELNGMLAKTGIMPARASSGA